MKRYLIVSVDEPVKNWSPKFVIAESSEIALLWFLRSVRSKNHIFREGVLDLSLNMSFAERFYLSTEQENDRFVETATAGTEPEIIQSRVRSFFSVRPELGDVYLQFMDSGDTKLITDEMFEFISCATPEESGLIALDLDVIEVLN